MNIALIIPPSPFLLDERVVVNLGILKVGAMLKLHRHMVNVIDLSGNTNYRCDVISELNRLNPDIVGFTSTTQQFPFVINITKEIREHFPKLKLIIGGTHPTLVYASLKRKQERSEKNWEAIKNHFDIIVAGDGELAIFEALERMNEIPPVIIDADKTSSPHFLTNKQFDEFPWPDRSLIDMDSYHFYVNKKRATSVIAQLGCPFASLTGDTLIFTENGFETLESLVSGIGKTETCIHGSTNTKYDLNLNVSTHIGQKIATSIIDEGLHKTFLIQTENGIKLKSTAKHPFLILRDQTPTWINAEDLTQGDWAILKTPDYLWPTENVKLNPPILPIIPPGGFERKRVTLPTSLSEDLAWIIGFIIGDGCLPSDHRPVVHMCILDQNQKQLTKIVNECFNVDLVVCPSSVTNKMKNGWIYSREVYEFFVQSIGINPNDKLHIPLVIRKSPKSVIKAFLNGLYEADGYISKKHEMMRTSSEIFANEISVLITMLGGIPNIQRVENQTCTNNEHFRIAEFHNDRIPTKKALYKSKKTQKWYWRTPRNKSCFLGIRRRTLIESKLNHPLNIPGWHYIRIEKISEHTIERVYDIHVPEDHSFLANGIISHNCGFCSGRTSPMLRKIRLRQSKGVIDELLYLHDKYKYTGYMFYDDELNVNPSMTELLDMLIDIRNKKGLDFSYRGCIKSELFTDEQAKKMAEAGFDELLVGFESGSDRILKNINKKATKADNERCVELARKHGLKIKFLMSIGHPGESPETCQDTLDWLLKMRPDYFNITIITCTPGMFYYDYAVLTDKGWTYTSQPSGDRLHTADLDYTKISDYYNGVPGKYNSFVSTDTLTSQDLIKWRDSIETKIREKFNLPYYTKSEASYDKSMGQ